VAQDLAHVPALAAMRRSAARARPAAASALVGFFTLFFFKEYAAGVIIDKGDCASPDLPWVWCGPCAGELPGTTGCRVAGEQNAVKDLSNKNSGHCPALVPG
jgi:hypothetical protein